MYDIFKSLNISYKTKMTFIILGAILIFIVSIIWVWHNLGNIEIPRKIAFILIGMLITYLITICLYNLSSSSITYPSEETKQAVSNVLIAIFTGVNSLILLPFAANIFDKILEEEIEKEQAKIRIIILVIIFVICIFAEKGYMKSTQEGIINIYNEVQNAEE